MFIYKNTIYIIGIILVSILSIHLFTLEISPLPWFDEVAFGIITKSYQNSGKFLWPGVYGDSEVLIYGPIYFWIQSIITDLFGWGSFQFRLLNFVASLIIVGIVAVLVKRYNKTDKIYYIVCAAFLLMDTVFTQNMHSGRMDLFATSIFLIGFLLFNLSPSNPNRIWYSLSAGAIISISMLCTPRVIFLFGTFVGLFILDIYKNKLRGNWINYVLAGISFLVIYFLWVFIKFGGITEFLSSYTNDNVVNHHIISFSFIRYKHQVPLFVLYFFVLILNFLFLRENSFIIKASVISLIVALFYFTIVEESGPYIAMLLPFLYGVIFISILPLLDLQKKWNSLILRVCLIVVLFVNMGIFGFKSFVVMSSMSSRNPENIEKEIRKRIPSGAKVVADYRYYYSLLKNQNQFRSLKTRMEVEDIVEYHLNNYGVEYIIMNDTIDQYESGLMHSFRKKAILNLVGNVKIEEGNEPWKKFTRKLGYTINSNYNGIVFKVNK